MRRRGRHAVKNAGPEMVTVPELQRRFEQAEDAAALLDDSPWNIVIGNEIRQRSWAELAADILADANLTIDRRPIPDGPPYVYGRDFHIAEPALVFDPPVDYTSGVSVSDAQRFRDRIAEIRPLIHEITKET